MRIKLLLFSIFLYSLNNGLSQTVVNNEPTANEHIILEGILIDPQYVLATFIPCKSPEVFRALKTDTIAFLLHDPYRRLDSIKNWHTVSEENSIRWQKVNLIVDPKEYRDVKNSGIVPNYSYEIEDTKGRDTAFLLYYQGLASEYWKLEY